MNKTILLKQLIKSHHGDTNLLFWKYHNSLTNCFASTAICVFNYWM